MPAVSDFKFPLLLKVKFKSSVQWKHCLQRKYVKYTKNSDKNIDDDMGQHGKQDSWMMIVHFE